MANEQANNDYSSVFTTQDSALEQPNPEQVLPMVDDSERAVAANVRERTSSVILATPDGMYEQKRNREGVAIEQNDPKEPSLTDAQKEKLFAALRDNLGLPDTCQEAKNKFGQIKRALETNAIMQRSLFDLIEAGLQPTAFMYDKDRKAFQFGDVLKYEDTEKHEAVLAALTPQQMDAAITCVIKTYSDQNEQPYTPAEEQEIRNWFAQNPQRASGQTGLNDLDALMFAGHFHAKLISHEENEVMARNNPKIYDRIWTWLGDQDLLKIIRSRKNGIAPDGNRGRGGACRGEGGAGSRDDYLAARVAGLWVQIT